MKRKHRSGKEAQDRDLTTARIGEANFDMPAEVRRDSVAKKKWLWFIELIKGANEQFITSAHVPIIARWCLAQAEYLRLQKIDNSIEKDKKLKLDAKMAKRELFGLFDKTHKLDKLLLMLEKELSITPLSELRYMNTKIQKVQDEDPLKKKGFGDVL
ncbi:MAG: hypothetical protein KC517_09245 [Bacteroidetes bacterium]|nr:hypothetical protein [Bacteroidota bacterium]